MPIRARTSNNGVHVHGNPDSTCATALPYVAGRLAVARRPPERRCRSGACGCGWERPPPSGCLDRHWGRSACARACHPPRRGRSRSIDPMREGCRVARACGNAARHPRSFGILDLKWHRNWHQVGDWRTTCAERLSKGLSTAGRPGVWISMIEAPAAASDCAPPTRNAWPATRPSIPAASSHARSPCHRRFSHVLAVPSPSWSVFERRTVRVFAPSASRSAASETRSRPSDMMARRAASRSSRTDPPYSGHPQPRRPPAPTGRPPPAPAPGPSFAPEPG